MKEWSKRIISFLLAFVLLIGAVPVNAAASETAPTAIPEETTAPAEETTTPTEETAAPTEETITPTEETITPTEETIAPTEEPATPTEVPMESEEVVDDTANAATIYVQASTFPDENFRNYILSQSYGADYMLTTAELEKVTYMDVSNMGIASLDGIEYFTALEQLYCKQNQLTNLYLWQNTALEDLNCDYNLLTELNVSGNRALESLWCDNNRLTSLEVNSALLSLNCGDNQLASLDLSANKELQHLYCPRNQLSMLDLSNNSMLRALYCNGNQLAALDLGNTQCNYVVADSNIRKITLDSQNQFDLSSLPGFDVTRASNWAGGTLNGNILTAAAETITYTYKLGDSFSETFTLQAVAFSELPAGSVLVNADNFPDDIFRDFILSQSYGADNLLTQEELAAVTVLKPQSMGIKSLKGIEYFTELTTLWCNFNELTELDVRKNTKLTTLGCNYNQLTSLDLSNNTKLTTLYSDGNNRKITLNALNQFDLSTLPGFDVSRASNWVGGTVSGNVLTATAEVITYTYKMSDHFSETFKLTATLSPLITVQVNEANFPDANFRNYILRQSYGADGVLTLEELSTVTEIDVTSLGISSLKGIEHFSALTNLYCYSNQLTTLDVSKNTKLIWLNCHDNQLTELDVSRNPALTDLLCYRNQLTALDVSKNTELTWLGCQNNKLIELDVSHNPALTSLSCDNNQLTELNVSKNTKLTKLYCYGNQLTELDVSKNTELTELFCINNQLTSLDVSRNAGLSILYCYGNTRAIELTKNNEFDLSTLPDFDVTRASSWEGGSVSGNTLTATSETITYTYALGNGKTETFTLNAGNYVPKTLKAPVVKIGSDAATGKPKLTWEAADGAVKYQVWRATSKNGKYTLMKTVTDTTYINNSAKTNTLYYYKVRSVDAEGKFSKYSSILSRRCDLPRPSITVSGVSSTGKIKVSWKAISGAKSYQVWRATSENGTYSLMKTTTSTSYTNTSAKAGQTYYYKVRAVHSNTNANSAYSLVKSRTCDLARPTVTLSSVASTGRIKVGWKAITGAVSYDIYRATGKNGTYSLVNNVTGTSFTDNETAAGKTYYYQVVAVHSNTNANSAKSTAVSRVCDLARPDVTISLSSKGKPRLTWEGIEGATKYEVYRATSKTGKYTLVKTTTGTSFTNTGAKKGTTYYYKVKAIHSNANANSSYSTIKSIQSK